MGTRSHTHVWRVIMEPCGRNKESLREMFVYIRRRVNKRGYIMDDIIQKNECRSGVRLSNKTDILIT